MKKILLASTITIILTACNNDTQISPVSSKESIIKEVAHTYCNAIKSSDFKSVSGLARHDILSNRVSMYENNKTKYKQLFENQNCTVKSIENISAVAYEVFFESSRLDSVQVGWSKKKEQYYIFGDSFKNDFK